LNALLGAVVPATGGMWIAVGVTYPAATAPGPGSIEFFNNIAPGTQWLATDSGGAGISYSNLAGSALVDIQTGPGFPPGSWVIRVESGAEYRPFGAGCLGSNGTPTLAGGGVLPMPGLVVVLDATNLPDPGIVDLMLLGQEQLNPAIDLGLIFGAGPVGCLIGTQPLVLDVLTNFGGSASYVLALPPIASLAGASLLGQVMSFDPGANAAGFTTSNGVRAVVGF
jgi:hypothetical protein